jgi:uncharacterized protein with von Willebrand factor type A (vWA) domain
MFADFFHELRDEGVPVGTQEWLLLLDALGKGLHGSSLQRFYHLSRCVLIKSETYFDAFDRAFLKVFEGIEGSLDIEDELLEWLKDPKNFRQLTDDERAMLEKLSSDELMRKFMQTLAEQTTAASTRQGFASAGRRRIARR